MVYLLLPQAVQIMRIEGKGESLNEFVLFDMVQEPWIKQCTMNVSRMPRFVFREILRTLQIYLKLKKDSIVRTI